MTTLTRAQQAQDLEHQGVTGAALDVLLKALSPARHQSRVQATLDATLATLPPEVTADGPAATATGQAAVILADLVGIGGPAHEALGAGTSRLPCFSGLGKGRKGATDGPAWMAAAESAMLSLERTHGTLAVQAGGEWPYLTVGLGDLPPMSVEPLATGLSPAIPWVWVVQVALHGLRASYGLPVQTQIPGTWSGDVGAWAAAYNAVTGAARKDRDTPMPKIGDLIANARTAGACDEGLDWAEAHRDDPVTLLAQERPGWYDWAKSKGVIP